MKFTVIKSSDIFRADTYEIEINSLDEMRDFQIKNKCSIIINFQSGFIEIYDTYRE